MHARRPSVIYTSISCYGLGGPWTCRRGWERQGQAGTEVFGAFATALALYHRQATGADQRVGASLAQTGTYHQAAFKPALAAALGAAEVTRLAGEQLEQLLEERFAKSDAGSLVDTLTSAGIARRRLGCR